MGKKKKTRCDPVKCGMEEKLQRVMDKFTTIAEKLAEGQQDIRITLQRLTDNMEFVEKLDEKVDRVECKVDKNGAMVWKMVGTGGALLILIPLALELYHMFG